MPPKKLQQQPIILQCTLKLFRLCSNFIMFNMEFPFEEGEKFEIPLGHFCTLSSSTVMLLITFSVLPNKQYLQIPKNV